MKYLIVFFFFLSLGISVKCQIAPFSFLKGTTVTTKDTFLVNLDTTQTQSGWINMTGDPSKNVITATLNGVIFSSTATANWIQGAGGINNCAYPNNGTTSGTIFPVNTMKEAWYSNNGSNADAYNSSKPKITITGLNPAKTYTIEITGSIGFGFNGNTEWRTTNNGIVGSPQTLQCGNSPNTSVSKVFATLSPDGTGKILIYSNGAAGTDVSVISAIKVMQN